MNRIEPLIDALEKTEQEVFWQGGASDQSILQLESQLNVRLPQSLRDFLSTYGGGGVVGEEISGIEDDNPQLEFGGTIYGDTITCRQEFNLPIHLIVIYFGDDDVVWCLDANENHKAEYPVVSFDVFTKSTQPLAESFEDFEVEYLTLRLSQ